MKFKIIEDQWQTLNTYKTIKKPKKGKEVKSNYIDPSDPSIKTAEEKRDEYLYKGKPYAVDKPHV